LALALATTVYGQHPEMPPGLTHEEHLAQIQREEALKARGALAMGFDQDTVTHHFALLATGGAIEVEVRDVADAKNLDAIRAHLRAIATQFAAGNFDAPFATHGEIPPGVLALQRLRSVIAYSYVETTRGGRVNMVTNAPEARAALHEFLRYQITEHHTGDSLAVR
jgi:hypothetical protein